jgi:hypothetical protein
VTISDNGVGLPQDFDLLTSSNLGLQIVRTLTENELQGELKEALEKAVSLRPRMGKAKPGSLAEGLRVKALPIRPQALPLGEKI